MFEIYGEKQIIKQRPYIVSHDKENNLWLIQGNSAFLRNAAGGVVNAIVSKETSEVMAIWHEE